MRNIRIKNIWKIVGLPMVCLAVVLSLWAVWKILDLPPQDELIEIIRKYFELYGYWIVFVSAIIEGMLLVGWYYPGSLVIFLGVIFAGRNIPEVVWIVSLVTVGLFVAYLFNYALGKYGWYKLLLKFGLREPIENAQTRLTKYGLSGILLSYWQPNLAVLTSTAAGIMQFSFKKFAIYSAVAVAMWDIFWGGLVYFLGEAALTAMGIRFVIVAIVVWIAYRLIFNRKYVIP
ncbi:MAG: VTT domain-containing protein [Patescibacteria group bacterium]